GSANWEQALRAEAASDWKKAQDLFAAASKDTDPPWVAAHALLKQAEVAERRGKDGLDAARDAMTEFLKRFPDHRLLPQALLDRVGTATCLLAGDDVTGARLLYGQLARDGQNDVAVKAAADNGLAECDFRDPAHLKEAQLGFARVAVAAAGVPLERARALYF